MKNEPLRLIGRVRRIAAAFSVTATLSLIGGTVAGGVGILPCAHHGFDAHASHRTPVGVGLDSSRGAGAPHPGADHADLPGHPERPDHGENRCDCLGSCTLLAGPPPPPPHARIGDLPDLRAAVELVSLERPGTSRQAWLYPLPNAPPCA
ncbi:MAG: hypothetical protein P8049_01320 [Gemmatimonadota bacterium]